MQKILTGITYYYYKENMADSVISLKAIFKDEIESDNIIAAVKQALAVNPYFAKKLVVEGNNVFLAENELEPTLLIKGETPVFNDYNNGHLFQFEVEDKTITLHIFRLLSDGNGLLPFYKTVVAYYFMLLGDTNPYWIDTIENCKVRFAGAEASADPFESDIWEDVEKGNNTEPVNYYQLTNSGQLCEFMYEIDARKLFEASKSYNVKPYGLINAFFWDAIEEQKIKTDADGVIATYMPIDMRGTLRMRNCQKQCLSHTTIAFNGVGGSIEEKCNAFRQGLRVALKRELLISNMKEDYETAKLMTKERVPIKRKCIMMQSLYEATKKMRGTVAISYLPIVMPDDPILDYVEDFDCKITESGFNILCEACQFGDRMKLYLQYWSGNQAVIDKVIDSLSEFV